MSEPPPERGRIVEFDSENEAAFLGRPFAQRIGTVAKKVREFPGLKVTYKGFLREFVFGFVPAFFERIPSSKYRSTLAILMACQKRCESVVPPADQKHKPRRFADSV